ncbi:hypothetical protein EKK58_07275 [Candidatus Dependentiae bacterium]|nr:MAG: hypothetical protein EKK58_07275 [Candidatus Dependentiae bacterium]
MFGNSKKEDENILQESNILDDLKHTGIEVKDNSGNSHNFNGKQFIFKLSGNTAYIMDCSKPTFKSTPYGKFITGNTVAAFGDFKVIKYLY